MKKEFIDTLIKLAEKDENIYLLTGDLGFSFFEKFAEKFPKRFINCGVAEQNMIGIAAGLAVEGKKVYIYSIIPFVVFRCFEQIRNDICYHNLDVKIIGVGAGFSYGTHGATHYGIEDIAVLRPLPNITILCPADPMEMENLILQSYKTKNPTYIRLDKNAEKIHNSNFKIILSKPAVLKNGKNGAIIAIGASLKTAINVAKKLEEKGYNFKVISAHTIKPINQNAWLKELGEIKLIFTIEEHRLTGGLGDMIGNFLLENNLKNVFLKKIGVSDKYFSVIGKQDYLRKLNKIDEKNVYKIILKNLNEK